VHSEFSGERRHQINDGFDLAIEVGLIRVAQPNRQVLFKGRRCLVGAASYLSQLNPARYPDDLEVFRRVVLEGVRGSKFTVNHKDGQEALIAPEGQISADSSLAFYSFAKAGAGIAIVSEFLIVDDVTNRTMDVLLPDWTIEALDVFAEWPVNAPKNDIVRLFVSNLRENEDANLK